MIGPAPNCFEQLERLGHRKQWFQKGFNVLKLDHNSIFEYLRKLGIQQIFIRTNINGFSIITPIYLSITTL